MTSLAAVALIAGLVSIAVGLAGAFAGSRTRYQVARKLGTHRPRVSTLGGPGILAGVLVGLLFAPYRAHPDPFVSAQGMMTRAWGITIALVLLFCWGLWLEWRAPKRHRWWLLLGQVLAGLVLFFYGFQIRELSLGRWTFATGVLNLPVTLLWVVLMINFLRFFDGIDGLMAAVGLFIVAAHLAGVAEREYFVHVLCAVFGGALGGFFLVTVYPARVYPGYNGSSLPGLCLAALTLASRSKTFTAATIVIPVAVLIVIAAFGLVLFVESRVLERKGTGGAPGD